MQHEAQNQWQELFSSSKLSLDNAAYEDAITNCSIVLEELTRKTVATLDVRAAAFGQSANYVQGLRDAYEMVERAPKLSTGYLRIGELHIMQGKHKLSIEILDQGLQMVPDSDAGYNQIWTRRQQSLEQLNRRIDFIVQLPFDILPKIMSYLPMHSRVLCTSVAKSWRARIHQCSSVWREITIDYNDNDDARTYNSLVAISDQVRELSLKGFDRDVPRVFMRSLKAGSFSQLQSLTLRRSRISSASTLLDGLAQISDTLDSLALISTYDEVVPLDSVLSICTSLTSFKYTGMSIQISKPSSLPAATKIVSLDLESTNVIRATQLELLLRCCPVVQNLYVYRCEPSAIRLIDQYSTILQTLKFNSFRIMLDARSTDQEATMTTGLRSIDICRVDAVTAINLAPLLNKSRETLEDLVLYMDDDVEPVQLWDPIATFILPRLRKLRCEIRPTMQLTVATLIRQSPCLQDITFEYSEEINGAIFNAIAMLSNLQRIAFNSVNRVDNEGLARLFQQHGTLGGRSPLRTFETDDFAFMTDEALWCLADVTTLESIRMDGFKAITADGMERFVNNLRPNSALHTLKIYNMEAVPDTAIQGLCKLENLRNVELIQLKSITDQSVADLVSTSLSLQSLWIYNCALVTKYMIKQAANILERKQLI